ncbi:unnamed protein product [Blepharisma stoltei]|uniref:HTH CENPB-type domain-containing protein n=1 Tax=Blepharisma stoltei TaxID=1481888 RepID=A0AAU9IUJ2_9CILI|nr:unnamed protein product [Blepharisma stoltei]
MTEEPHSASKKQSQIARYAIINGIPKTVKKFSVSSENVERWISALEFGNLPLLEKTREMILETSVRKGSKGASRDWGLSEGIINSLKNDYMSSIDKDSLKVEDSNAQVTPESFKEYKESRSQTKEKHLNGEEFAPRPRKIRKTSDEKRYVNTYSTARKIQAVREYMKNGRLNETAKGLEIPSINIVRWRDKIKNELFQASHVEHLYKSNLKGQINKFFRDIDECLNDWYNLHKDTIQDTSAALREKAEKLAKLDDNNPVISEEWLENFKKFYKII